MHLLPSLPRFCATCVPAVRSGRCGSRSFLPRVFSTPGSLSSCFCFCFYLFPTQARLIQHCDSLHPVVRRLQPYFGTICHVVLSSIPAPALSAASRTLVHAHAHWVLVGCLQSDGMPSGSAGLASGAILRSPASRNRPRGCRRLSLARSRSRCSTWQCEDGEAGARISGLHSAPHTPCAVLYVPMLIDTRRIDHWYPIYLICRYYSRTATVAGRPGGGESDPLLEGSVNRP